MVICELCGSANVETDEQCRVCGQVLKQQQAATAPVAAAATWAPPAQSAPIVEIEPASVDTSNRSLQMSAVGESVPSDAPPMLGSTQQDEIVDSERSAGSDVPSFMQAGHRTQHAAPDPVQLISANDLPDWIKQIAAADAAKVEAEAIVASPHPDTPATIVKKALPGETMVAAPSTNWLSKSAQATESTDHWDTSEIANANWGNPDTSSGTVSQEYPSLIPPTSFVPSSGEAYTTSKPKKRLSLGGGNATGKPIYRQQTFQLLMLVVLVALFAVLMLL